MPATIAARLTQTHASEKLVETSQKLLTVKEHLDHLRMEVVLREPLDEELQEMRDWLAEIAPGT